MSDPILIVDGDPEDWLMCAECTNGDTGEDVGSFFVCSTCGDGPNPRREWLPVETLPTVYGPDLLDGVVVDARGLRKGDTVTLATAVHCDGLENAWVGGVRRADLDHTGFDHDRITAVSFATARVAEVLPTVDVLTWPTEDEPERTTVIAQDGTGWVQGAQIDAKWSAELHRFGIRLTDVHPANDRTTEEA